MKARYLAVLAVLIGMLSVTGCSALFGNMKQYDEGDWYLFAGSSEVARMKRDQLALKKLDGRPTAEAEEIGYRGTLFNKSTFRSANFVITGPENKGFYLAPLQKEYYNFSPGTYVATLYDDYGHVRGKPWVFHVNAQTHSFMGEKVHWYLTAPP